VRAAQLPLVPGGAGRAPISTHSPGVPTDSTAAEKTSDQKNKKRKRKRKRNLKKKLNLKKKMRVMVKLPLLPCPNMKNRKRN
jgi:hypothetical protein